MPNIIVTDSNGVFTVIGSGSRVSGLQNPTAVQIQGWVETNQVFLANPNAPMAAAPFAVGSGDCLYDTSALFCFAGPQNSDADNVLMVFWVFPLNPNSGDTGQGQLNAPPSSGAMTGGLVTWEVV
jgi:hypothetical protein